MHVSSNRSAFTDAFHALYFAASCICLFVFCLGAIHIFAETVEEDEFGVLLFTETANFQ